MHRPLMILVLASLIDHLGGDIMGWQAIAAYLLIAFID